MFHTQKLHVRYTHHTISRNFSFHCLQLFVHSYTYFSSSFSRVHSLFESNTSFSLHETTSKKERYSSKTMKDTSKVIIGATLVMVVTLAFVVALILVLLDELYCSLLLHRHKLKNKNTRTLTNTKTTLTNVSSPSQSHSPQNSLLLHHHKTLPTFTHKVFSNLQETFFFLAWKIIPKNNKTNFIKLSTFKHMMNH